MAKKRRILITGGAGFIGSCLAEKLISNPDNFVVLVDDLSTGEMKKLPQQSKDNWRFVKCDVNNYRDIAEVMLANHFDYVFHYAAFVGVKQTQANPIKVLKDLYGIEHIFDLCKNSGVKRVFFASSSEVYGEPVDLPQNEETTPLNSRIPYAVVKNVGEAYLKSYKKEYDLDYTCFRFFNTYGPKQSVDFVMSKFIALALKNEPIPIYGDGMQTRTFCFIDDNIEATSKTLYSDEYINDVVNIGSDFEITIIDLAKMVIRLTGSGSVIEYRPPLPEGDMKRRYPDITKMRKLLNRDLISMEDGIKRILSDTRYIIPEDLD
ncbi:MAG: NAD-dependent epimerase/dehydratase family protein [Bacteroidetes bacterium]|nr:MAG: NAD-dependent epimerase/dehydratase family protein [Bacteroidota bacterium]